MKRIFTILFAAMLAGQAWAGNFTIDNLNYYVIGNTKTVSVGKADTNPTGDLVIPSEVEYNDEKYTVTGIEWVAFTDCHDLTSVTIPNSIISIGDDAFTYCRSLATINIAGENTNYCSVDGVLFDKNMTTLIRYPAGKVGATYTIPNGVTNIGNGAFYDCNGLTSVTIPNSVTNIGRSAFYSCSSLKSITIPESVTSIDVFAFGSCTSLTSIDISNGITNISNDVFFGCKSLTSITIPNSITSIGNSAFGSCNNLTSITIPNGVTSIGKEAFKFCVGLTSIRIPESVTNIGDYAFSNCSSLVSINIPEGVSSIGEGTFYSCSNLRTIDISENVISIGVRAFEDCNKLETINIPKNVTGIGERVFYGCSGLISVSIPYSVTNIGNAAFRDCRSLSLVIIPESVTGIGDRAFYDCRGLTSVIIPKTVENIGDYAFSFCSNLKQITIYATYDYGLPTLGTNAFSNNSCNVIVPCGQTQNYKDSGWEKYSKFTFVEDFLYEFTVEANYPEMGKVEILQMPDCSNPATVKATANEGYVFVMWDDKSTTEENSSVYASGDRRCIAYFAPADADINIIPKNYNTAFWYYNADTKTLHVGGHGELMIEADYMWGDLPKAEVEHVYIEDGFTYIDASTFQNFKALKDVRLPATLKNIGSTSFNGCESLESVVIPEGVREIEYGAFNGCSSMKYVVLPSTLQKISSRVFTLCPQLDSIVMKCDTAPLSYYNSFDTPAKFYIPCGMTNTYFNSNYWWHETHNNDRYVETMLYNLSVSPSDSKRGTAAITQAPDCGTNAIVTATAKTNYQFLKWSNGATANPYEFNLDKDMSLTAIFVGKQSEITAEAATNGVVSVPQYAYFEDSVTVKAIPTLGYEVDKITITAGNEKLELKNNKFKMPLTDVTINATFKLADYKIIVDIKNAKITVPKTAHYGDTVEYELELDYGYWVSSLSVDYSLFDDKQYFIMPAEDITITGEILRISRIVRYGYDEWREYVGDTVKFDIEPRSGYHVEFEAWNFMSGEIVEVKMVDGTSFIMPDSDIEVSYSYVKGAPVTETAANTINIYAAGNKIVVENATDEIFVYNAMGVLVCRDDACRVRQITVNTPGVFIVKTGGTVKRVVVN
jgi:hypothetical protein